jgi:hypothetical protein
LCHAVREPGSNVTILIRRAGFDEAIPYKLNRATIHFKSVPAGTEFEGGVGYISLNPVSESSAQELRDEIVAMRGKGMKAMVLDLRNNPGGLLDQGIKVSCLCPTAVETRPGQFTNYEGIGLVQSPAEIADVAVKGLDEERFLILPNPAVGGSFRKKAEDYDAWLARSIKRISPIKQRGPWDDRFPPPDPSTY